jgi:hypothetical protein
VAAGSSFICGSGTQAYGLVKLAVGCLNGKRDGFRFFLSVIFFEEGLLFKVIGFALFVFVVLLFNQRHHGGRFVRTTNRTDRVPFP